MRNIAIENTSLGPIEGSTQTSEAGTGIEDAKVLSEYSELR